MTSATPPNAHATAHGLAERLVAGWMDRVMAWPRRVLGALGVLIILAVLAGSKLGVDPDSSKMLSPELPDQARAQALNAAFPGLKSTLAVVVRGPSADATDLVVAALAEGLEGNAWVETVFATAADPFLAAHGFLYQDMDAVETMFTRISKSSNTIARLRTEQTIDGFARALDDAARLAEGADIDQASLDRLYAEAALVLEAEAAGGRRIFGWSAVLDDQADPGPTTRVISVLPRLDPDRISPAKPALRDIEAAIAALPADLVAGIEIAVTGDPALRTEELDSVLGTIAISLALSLVLVAVILRIGLGSAGRAALAFGALLGSLVLTTGFAALAVGQLNLVSVAFIVLMVGLGIDFAIHILAHVTEMRGNGVSARDAVRLTGQRNGLALGLSAATTCLAFLAFATTDFIGMAQLGLIGGVGVLIAFGVAVTLIPAVVALLPGLAGTGAGAAARRTLPRKTGDGTLLATGMLVLGALAVLPALQARFDPDPMGLRDPAAASVQAFQLLASEPETTPYRASVLTPSLDAAEATATRLDTGVGIGGTLTIADLVPDQQDDKLTFLDFAAPSIEHAVAGTPTDLTDPLEGDSVNRLIARLDGAEGADSPSGRLGAALAAYQADRTPDRDAALTTALFQAFPLMLTRLESLLAADYVDQDALPSVLRDRFVSADGQYRVEVLPDGALQTPAQIAAFADIVSDLAAEAAGGPVQLAAAGQSVGRAMLFATLLAALSTAFLAYWATRRVADTVAILVPLGIAGILTAAASVLLGMPFNYANVIVLPLLIGIGVDSGIHMALRERRAPGAVFATSTPRAVVVSALTTMAAFGTLALSDHRGTASMGALLAISMTAAICAILTLTPALIRWSRRDNA
ncbi:MAG: MMPL family transporter [Pseudomonadota bacterium]